MANRNMSIMMMKVANPIPTFATTCSPQVRLKTVALSFTASKALTSLVTKIGKNVLTVAAP